MPHDHADHDHGRDHTHDQHAPVHEEAAPGYFELMETAVRELLVERKLIGPDEIRRQIEVLDSRSPALGAKVVARAWTDPAFRDRLLANGRTACEELGISFYDDTQLIVLENTEAVHNLIVCTLCSCYPRPVLGLPPDWYKARAGRFVAGIGHAARLDDHQLHFRRGIGLVLAALGHHEHLARLEIDGAVAEIDAQRPVEHDERLVGLGMAVPVEVAFEPHDLELVVVHLGNDLGLPLLGEQGELPGERDGDVGHGGGFTVGATNLRSVEASVLNDRAGWTSVTAELRQCSADHAHHIALEAGSQPPGR